MIRSPAGFDGGDRIKRYLDYYQPSYGVMMLSAGQAAAFSPASLFAAGEQGVWYDPSDFSTMFQDSAGTTPVTAVEQPVGLLLDKSQGLVVSSTDALGGNGNFSNASYWADINGVSTISGGQLSFNGSATLGGVWSGPSNNPLTIGRFYQVTFDVVSISSGGIRVWLGTATPTYTATTTGTHTFRAACIGDIQVRIYNNGAATSAVIDNLVIREVLGNHAFQATSASRPVLSARVNLLTYSEDFRTTAAAGSSRPWLWQDVTVANTTAVTAPDGTLTADKIVEGTTNTHHVAYQVVSVTTSSATFTVYARAAERSWLLISAYMTNDAICYFDLANGALGAMASGCTGTITLDGDWYRCTVTRTVTAGIHTLAPSYGPTTGNNSGTYAGNGTSGIYIWGADLRVTNVGVGIPAYQRVTTSTDYDTTGFPYYLRFDGTDDSMATGTITPGTDKAQVFGGVRKLSDAALGVLLETGIDVTSASYAGSLAVFAPSGVGVTSYQPFFRGTTGRVFETITPFVSPITNVLTFLMSNQLPAAGDAIQSRANGVAVTATESSNITTAGNFLAYPLYIGSRAGSSLRFNGNIYSLIVRFGSNLDATTISNTETWVNSKTLAY